jgi:hypothetical protein
VTSRATFWRRRLVALTLVAATAAGGVAALRPAAGETQEGGLVTPVPVLGAADARMVLMGAAPQAAGGEAWGYRLLSTLVPPPVADGERLTFGPRAGERPQLAFLRAAGGGPWQIAQTPLDAGGRPYRGPEPNAASARVTARGGGVLVGRDAARADAERLVVLVRDPGKRYREIKLPAGTTPQPGAVLAPGETIALDQGAGRVAVGAFDGGTKTHVLFGALGVPREQAIVNFDGATFTREPIRLPASATTARIVAIDTIGADAAFALVDTNATAEDGIELYRRFGDGASAFWARQGFGQGGAPFTESDTPARAISDVAPLGGNADPLTVTPDGIWIDGSLRTTQAGADPVESSFTLFVSTGSYELTGSWCDALDGNGDRVCERDLGIELDRATGYRSFAWGGARFGTRVVTNPLEPGGTEETNRGTYLRFAGESFRRQPGGTGNGHPTAAFTSVDDGWLEGPVRISTQPRPSRLVRWPVALRSVLTAAAAEPGKPVGATDAQALAVGADGAVARFVPGQGWTREFLLTASGAVARPRLRGVAWPEPGRAHAVGDAGAMWQWRADTQLWERDPATPIGFEGQLVDVAFQPGRPDRGFAVGRAGTLLRYDKTWTQDAVPAEASSRDLTSVSFAGGQALATAGPDLLVEDGAGWRPDPGVRALLAEVDAGDAQLLASAACPTAARSPRGATSSSSATAPRRRGGSPTSRCPSRRSSRSPRCATATACGPWSPSSPACSTRRSTTRRRPTRTSPRRCSGRCRSRPTATCCARPTAAGATRSAPPTRRRRSTARSRATPCSRCSSTPAAPAGRSAAGAATRTSRAAAPGSARTRAASRRRASSAISPPATRPRRRRARMPTSRCPTDPSGWRSAATPSASARARTSPTRTSPPTAC